MVYYMIFYIYLKFDNNNTLRGNILNTFLFLYRRWTQSVKAKTNWGKWLTVQTHNWGKVENMRAVTVKREGCDPWSVRAVTLIGTAAKGGGGGGGGMGSFPYLSVSKTQSVHVWFYWYTLTQSIHPDQNPSYMLCHFSTAIITMNYWTLH